MRLCPKCRRRTLDYDAYFCRFRCLNPKCGWMPPSTAEREIRLLQSANQPIALESMQIPELGVMLTPSYDRENDAFSIDFGLDEPTFDLPDPDGRMTWRIGRESDTVAGFTVVGLQQMGISGVSIAFIMRRKADIERGLRRLPDARSRQRATRDLVEQVVVTAISDEGGPLTPSAEVESAWNGVVNKVQQLAGT